MSAKILLVDDHAMFREGVRGLLERKGFLVVGEANNGREAIEKARELSPDVVVMDITMPELDGIEATRGIMTESPEAISYPCGIEWRNAFIVEGRRQ